MDNFMDKITRKLNSQDMIRANAAADAAELEHLENQMAVFKDQMGKYDDCLKEMRQLNLKNIESAQGVRKLTEQAGEKLEKTMGAVESASIAGIKQTSDVSIAGIQLTSDASIAGIHQTVQESLAKIARIQDNTDIDDLVKNLESLMKLKTEMADSFTGLEDFLHTDNVKVYRNVQAAMIEELEKQTNELKEEQQKVLKSNKALMPLIIAALLLSFANLGILIAGIVGWL